MVPSAPRLPSGGPILLPAILGLAHGLADGTAGLLLGSLPASLDVERGGALVLVYNALAFAGQPFAGLLADHLRRPRAAALVGLGAMIAAALAATVDLVDLAVVLAGIGSAAFHAGGGALALTATPGRASGPGIFAAPGVVGLAIGGAFAVAGYVAYWPAALLLLALAAVLWRLPVAQRADSLPAVGPILERHDVVMIALLAGIALRSAVWTTIGYLLAGQWEILI